MGLNTVLASQSVILRGTRQQTSVGLLYQPPSLVVRSVSPITGEVSTATFQEGMAVRRYEIHNRSGSTASVGIGFRLTNRCWVAGQFSAGGVFTDDTADAQDVGTSDFIMGTDAANDGFVIACSEPFGWFSVSVGTAEVDAGGATVPDHGVQYSNSAGTGWTALDTASTYANQFTLTNTVIGTGAREFVWIPPSDWGKVTAISTIPVGYYAINVTTAQAEASDTAALATAIEVGTILAVEAVADNGMYEQELSTMHEPLADALVAFFSVAGAGNQIYAEVTTG